ncbi:F-BOX DOMAIN CONTAINING PROTEIN EXPRESSED [Salix purpurea]|uniref:F-BOX DOMAIN CONTAINING PROTEIN EXPRESSED n=1 Tax=Salix purpurea TaxID=77065 RepID=A0A9Q0SWV2_SALPP|nr:F-BOX DOMAIN CONTAINING PROTEIN EXPRESSED [Salix purpurea]
MGPPPGSKRSPSMKRSSTTPTSIRSLEHDTLCIIFSYLGLFDVVRSSAVCKFWNGIIKRSKLLQLLYLKQQRSSRSSFSEESLNVYLEELAIEHQRQSLVRGSLHIDQWKGHSLGVDQCRMKRGLVLTGVGDKVMRLWSLERYRCIEEYSIPDGVPLVDFDFDESKIVGLVGTRICIWRRNGQRSIFPSREGQFIKGSCMRYFDPEAVVGCEDGTARVFDMYSKKCSRIVRMHTEPVTCLSLSEDQLIISGSSLGRITVSGLSSDQRVATLRPTDSTGIKSLCFNPASHHVFAGTTAGYASCWDLRTMRQLWKTQNTGEILTSYVMDHGTSSSSGCTHGVIERKIGKRIAHDYNIDRIPKTARPPITCLAVGMQKVITTHNSKNIRMWKFNNLRELN